ncbi:hypothetical protein F3I55_04440 [Pantoea sp. VH_24]|uniref:Uncharacterized protein n=1 Tax=Candidatus Pantoea gossypiicola TaxID=2608008 RepID=A0AB34CN58_9GAMM|nr:hypothetical protein [Pantoea sp. VH_24]KAA5963102.1 hypothetical protein F3I53_04185 [Pantoea sp. VH_16]KAA5989501.1 hypothetical protein F3I49_02925 [Pantoea sp. M_4]KAA6002609.1 hypothetical protein F3I46_04240 [Pantoea sp. M_1]KAA6016613.1 hypothetical protein F3I44_02995 [Pantoea sp. F_5]KAA6026845.1 hypothetical protein F3I42_02995 [Pantoea sp. F_17]KAA6112385.1 hypothetical protein F3I25_00515 [Pantoea sp. Bo_14]KAA6114511.1 hypothetical protein F3I23_00515 [Pantoea sp. Bo_11]KAA6
MTSSGQGEIHHRFSRWTARLDLDIQLRLAALAAHSCTRGCHDLSADVLSIKIASNLPANDEKSVTMKLAYSRGDWQALIPE